jgi:hydrogenase/urease accessory protein HupE
MFPLKNEIQIRVFYPWSFFFTKLYLSLRLSSALISLRNSNNNRSRKSMPEILPSKRLWSICLILLLSAKIFAHDAGLSSLNIEIDGPTITIRSDYSRREIEKISIDDEQLSGLARTSVGLNIDGRWIEPDQTSSRTDGHAITLSQTFRQVSGNKMQIQSLLLGRLNPEHKQFLSIRRADGKTVLDEILTSQNSSAAADLEKLASAASSGRFLPLGIEHILFGFDHLLFLLALLLTVKSFGEIAKIVTSFTVAHSITLSLAALGFVQIPPGLVEPLIALSIIFVGLENLRRKPVEKRWIPAYFFGLIHGFGFAAALQEIGIGTGIGAALPLLAFNLGVEIGQIAVVLLILPVLWKLQKSPLYLSRIVPVGSALVALAGLYWLIERILL